MYFVLTTSSIWHCCCSAFADLPWRDSPRLEIPDGEQHKTLATVEQIWHFLFAHHATRDDILVCVGGGVICDLGGFAASTYKRGMPHINVPTTLLAMVDAASGGKTGFDYAGVKNAIGTYAPALQRSSYPRSSPLSPRANCSVATAKCSNTLSSIRPTIGNNSCNLTSRRRRACKPSCRLSNARGR